MSVYQFRPMRRSALKLAAAGVLAVAMGPALAADYPNRPISLIVSAAPGGTTDSCFAEDQTLTAALLDRLLHHAHIVQITGESYRLKDKRRAGSIEARN